MKFWYHLIAAVVGLALAALIVYLVFGTASEEGATQEGSAGALDAGAAALCGTIDPADTTAPKSRQTAERNLPAMYDGDTPIPAITKDRPDQQSWMNRVHAAAGLCTDQIRVEQGHSTITMSTVDGVSEEAASAYAMGAIAEAFTAPFNPPGCASCRVTLVATVGNGDRTASLTRRAWDAFELRRRALNQPRTMRSLANFRKATSFKPADLRLSGWS